MCAERTAMGIQGHHTADKPACWPLYAPSARRIRRSDGPDRGHIRHPTREPCRLRFSQGSPRGESASRQMPTLDRRADCDRATAAMVRILIEAGF